MCKPAQKEVYERTVSGCSDSTNEPKLRGNPSGVLTVRISASSMRFLSHSALFLLKHLLDIFTATCGLLGGEDFTLHCPWFLQQHPEAMDPCWTAHACVKERGSIGVWLRRSSDSQTENATETPALSKLSLLSNTFYSSATANG